MGGGLSASGVRVRHGSPADRTTMTTSALQERFSFEDDAFDVSTPPLAIAAPSLRLIRRNGHIVPWDTDKIEIAVRKAFLAVHQPADAAAGIAVKIAARAEGLDDVYVNIELVQDMVQEELMRAGHFKVAEAYIVYRARRAFDREHEAETKPTDANDFALIDAVDERGDSILWDGADLRPRIEYASIGLELGMSLLELETELRRSLGGSLTTKDIQRVVVLNAKSLMERDSAFAYFAGRILLSYIYEECLGWDIVRDGIGKLKDFHARALAPYVKHAVSLGRLSEDLLAYDMDRLAQALDPTADLDFDFLGIQTLYDRYLMSDKTGGKTRRMETPQMFWLRVSMGLFKAEPGDREARVIELYGLYKTRRFCSSTPTLFNSGTDRSQLSSCYLYKIDDSLESIVIRGIAENAMLSKWAGGLGGSWTAVRGTGGYIHGTNGESQGVVPFLKMHNDQLVAVNQGGKRAGSGCAYLETWHNDIIDFLELRKNTGDDRRRTHDMNTANWIPDLFMKRMEARSHWTLFHSNETPELHELYGKAFEAKYAEYEAKAERGEIWSRRIDAIDLWKRMLAALFETGHPWITFKDPCNLRSPQDHVGVIHSSNLCTEITLNTSADETAVCNLGSIVLDEHLTKDGDLDHDKLRETVRIAVRALDNVIDINFYPTDPARTSNLRHRPIGLGVMGLQYALYRKGLAFASEEAIEFNDEAMEAIAYYAYEASSDLAAERGAYSTYKGSKWDRGLLPQDTLELLERERGESIAVARGGRMDWRPLREKIATQGMRNSNVIAIAPTATIANIMGTAPCIEPMYKNLFVKSNLSGDFVVLNPFMVADLKAAGIWTKEIRDQIKYFDGELAEVEGIPQALKERYLTAFHVPYEALVDAAARRQKWIDQSQSLNLFLGSPDMKAMSHMYRYAWRAGLKTTYYLRTLGASNIEKATVSLKKKTFTEEEKQACNIEAMRNGEECEACQ
ncbi:ribonucleoside-diphosphate reductase subunit alpha [bacterium]|nr:MAG: ribonucleoside-diphosphate reductase subunit alpha [bacterium]